jgi:hypothetical protein
VTPAVARFVFCRILIGLLFGLASLPALASDTCRVAFDMGSSGIRAGASSSQAIVRTEFDYLGEWWGGRSLRGAVAPTVAALRDLPSKGEFSADCEKIGGGFSAWRLAAQANVEELTEILEYIHAATGVSILVIPQSQEGAYGYFGSRLMLGGRMTTTHVLDIGGGSLQISGEKTSYADALGQKVWHRELCQVLRGSDSASCSLQPMTGKEVAVARILLAERLKPVADKLSGSVTLTAISRPVSRSVLPAVRQIAAVGVDQQGFSRLAVTQAIDRVAPLTTSETASLSGIGPNYAAYLVSDMLLVEAVLLATAGNYLDVAEVDLTNIPGLLADDHAFSWGKHYGCYLDRLRSIGLQAYESEAASCPQ